MDKHINLLNLKGKGPSSENRIGFSIFLSEIQRESDVNTNSKKCKLCGKANIKFCNSHSVPQFVLKKIAVNGELHNSEILDSTPLFKPSNGLKNAHTFHLICSGCDSSNFQDYENENNYNNEPTQLMLKQIALKNYLAQQDKHNNEINILKNSRKNLDVIKKNFDNKLKKCEIVLDKTVKQVKKVYKALKDDETLYKLNYYKKLDYTIPVAMQGRSIIFYGFDGALLNFPLKTNYDVKDDVHICLFPFKDSSAIIMFTHQSSNKYNKFFQTINSLDSSTQLSIINFITFAYFEDFFLNKNLNSSVINDPCLQNLSRTQPIACQHIQSGSNKKKIKNKKLLEDAISAFKESYNIDEHYKIPNLLERK